MITLSNKIDDVDFSIQLPDDAIEAIREGERWRGRIVASPKTKNGRMQAIQKEISQKGQQRNFCRATVNQRRVIRAWNRSRYIQTQERSTDRETRNNLVPNKKIREILPLVSKALREIGLEHIIRYMESYFDLCSTGGHIWDDRNHGFKTLKGFLEKIIKLAKTKEKPWWDIRETPTRQVNDVNARLTNRIANSFAQTFMGEDTFPLEIGSKEHVHFVKTSAQIISYIKRKKQQGIELTQAEIIKCLLEFVIGLFDQASDVVYPAHLSSSAVWASFPQYLSQKGVL